MFEIGKKGEKKEDPKKKSSAPEKKDDKKAPEGKKADKPAEKKDSKPSPKKAAPPAPAAIPPMDGPPAASVPPVDPMAAVAPAPVDPSLPVGPEMGMGGSGTVDKAVVVYMTSDFGPFQCSNCMHFQAPGACEVVAGDIDPAGLCHVFEPSMNGMQQAPELAGLGAEMPMEPPMEEPLPEELSLSEEGA